MRILCLLFAAFAVGSIGALEPAELLRQIRSTTIDPEGAVAVRNLQLELGPARLEIERGVLFPARTAGGETIELVFVGQARFLLVAPDEIEAGQLELFTGERSLDAPVDEAVLVLANHQTIESLLERPSPRQIRTQLTVRAEELHREWLDKTERRRSGVAAGVFKALVGDEAYRDYFAVWCRSFELGDFVFQLDPEDVEPVTLASFIPLDMTSWEKRRVRRHIRIQQNKGRWLGVRLEDLGAWDIWLSTQWSPAEGLELTGNVGFETNHYELDVKFLRDRFQLEGQARLHLTARASGRRVVRLELFSDLEIDEVRDESGHELFSFRSGDEIVVLLPEPSEAGGELILDVRYSGRVLQWVGGHTFDLLDTSDWYPRCGVIDRATYDVTLRWPKKYQLIASGRVVDQGKHGRYRWERRVLDRATIAFSLVFGNFHIESAWVDDVELVMAFNLTPAFRPSPRQRQAVLDTASRALRIFEQTFGEYPLDRLILVTLPRTYSQSYLGFITLAESILSDVGTDRVAWRRDMTIAHEIAHQWWGNLVGWWSYRDQWLSEGMANYAALLFDSHPDGGSAQMLGTLSAGWRDSLSQTTLQGRTVESLGPIVLGSRLNSSRAYDAYRPIVYRKGAVVLSMLARTVGPDRFHEMLGALSEAATDTVMTTDSFVKSIEKMSGMDLEGFARQFIYGTGIPQVHYDYDVAYSQSGGWTVEGGAHHLRRPRYRVVIVRDDETGWGVRREASVPELDWETTLIVPYRVVLEQDDNPGFVADRREGQLFIEGDHDSFVIGTDLRPIELKLDPRGEILASFFTTDDHMQRVLRYEAENHVARGELEQAELRFRKALEVPGEDPGPLDPLNADFEQLRADARIRLALARVYIDQGRVEEAESELDRVDEIVAFEDPMRFRMERDVLRAQIDLGRGDARGALRRLKKTLRLASSKRESWRHLLWRLQLNSERLAVAEAFALAAVAAYRLDAEDELYWALDEARERGVSISALQRAATTRLNAVEP